MYKVIITDYEGKEIEIIVSAEVFEVFDDSRKQGLREENEMRRHRDYRGLQNHYVLQELASPVDELENDVYSQLLIYHILEIVKTCTPIQQEQFFLYYIVGYKQKEIALLQDKSVSAITLSLQRIIRKLKIELK